MKIGRKQNVKKQALSYINFAEKSELNRTKEE